MGEIEPSTSAVGDVLESPAGAGIVCGVLLAALLGTVWAVLQGHGLDYTLPATSSKGLLPAATFGAYVLGALLAGAALLTKPRRAWLRWTGVAVLAITLLTPAIISKASLSEGGEYHQMLAGFMTHGTPAIDDRADALVSSEAQSEGWATPDWDATKHMGGGVLKAGNGARYAIHFWLSSLAATPIAFVLRLVGVPWPRAFAVLNALLVCISFTALLFWSGFRDVKSRLFAALWLLSPVTWYISWSTAEVWSGTLLVLGIVLFSRRRYAWATLLVALAATQNPPLLLVVAVVAATGIALTWRDSSWRGVLPIAAAALVAVIPNLFYLAVLGTLNPIVKVGAAGFGYVSLGRFIGFFLDLNQGLLPYVPVLLLAWIATLVLAAVRRNWFALGLGACVFAMVVLAAMTSNWNSGAAGIMRYAIWVLPVIAWTTFGILRPGRPAELVTLWAIVIGQLLIVLLVFAYPRYVPDYRSNSPLVMWVFEHVPRLYIPDAEVFIERARHMDGSTADDYPVAVLTEDGRALKVIFHESQAASVDGSLGLPAGYATGHQYASDAFGLYYIDVPSWAAKPPTASN